MGALLKYVLLFVLVYLVVRSIGRFFRLMSGGAPQGKSAGNPNRRTRPNDGNVNVDYQPNSKKRKKDYGGGEYVDYEEVK